MNSFSAPPAAPGYCARSNVSCANVRILATVVASVVGKNRSCIYHAMVASIDLTQLMAALTQGLHPMKPSNLRQL